VSVNESPRNAHTILSARRKLSPEEAIDLRKYKLRIVYPMAARVLTALITGGLGSGYAWVSYMEGLNMTLAYVGIVLCAPVPFALVGLRSHSHRRGGRPGYEVLGAGHNRVIDDDAGGGCA
jgi:hypothetical protein